MSVEGGDCSKRSILFFYLFIYLFIYLLFRFTDRASGHTQQRSPDVSGVEVRGEFQQAAEHRSAWGGSWPGARRRRLGPASAERDLRPAEG